MTLGQALAISPPCDCSDHPPPLSAWTPPIHYWLSKPQPPTPSYPPKASYGPWSQGLPCLTWSGLCPHLQPLGGTLSFTPLSLATFLTVSQTYQKLIPTSRLSIWNILPLCLPVHDFRSSFKSKSSPPPTPTVFRVSLALFCLSYDNIFLYLLWICPFLPISTRLEAWQRQGLHRLCSLLFL